MLSSLRSSIARLRARPASVRPGCGTRTPLASRRLLQTEAAGASAESTYSPVYKARKESSWSVALLLAGFVPIFTFGLGTWQMQRLQWKIALIDELEEKLQRDPIALPPKINLSVIPEFIYRRVLIRGRWDHAHSMLVGPRIYDGTHGFHLITPLIRTDGTTVLVDRGFVSKEQAQNPIQNLPEGEVQVLGMLRTSQPRNNFTPDNEPEKGTWYWVDADAMAKYAGGAEAGVQPVFIEEIFEGHGGEAASRISRGIPLGRPPTVDIRNAHMSYVITWYSLSAFTSAMFVAFLMKRRGASRVKRLPR